VLSFLTLSRITRSRQVRFSTRTSATVTASLHDLPLSVQAIAWIVHLRFDLLTLVKMCTVAVSARIWRQNVPSKRCYTATSPRGVTTQKTTMGCDSILKLATSAFPKHYYVQFIIHLIVIPFVATQFMRPRKRRLKKEQIFCERMLSWRI
jgi:hypothetical protein